MTDIEKNTFLNRRLKCRLGDFYIREEDEIDSGAQGTIYRAEIKGNYYAIKIFNQAQCAVPGFKDRIRAITEYKDINSSKIVMPLCLIEDKDIFGYVMYLVPSGFKKLCNFIYSGDGMDELSIYKTAINVSAAFTYLHLNQKTYKDIHTGNILCSDDGDLRVIDCDNVAPIDSNWRDLVQGAETFAAPEKVEGLLGGKYDVKLTRRTDLHSLAVVLFELLCTEHPLDGINRPKDIDDPSSRLNAYGYNAKFIFSDEDNMDKYIDINDSNQVSAKMKYLYMTDEIQAMFRTAFTKGITKAECRPDGIDWVYAMVRLMATLYYCPYCGDTSLYNQNDKKRKGGVYCPQCEEDVRIPRMRVLSIKNKKDMLPGDHAGYIVMLYDNAPIYNVYFDMSTRDLTNDIDNLFDVAFRVEHDDGGYRFRNVGNYIIYDEDENIEFMKGDVTPYFTHKKNYIIRREQGAKDRYITINI